MKKTRLIFLVFKKIIGAVIVKIAKAVNYPLRPRYLNFPVTYKCNSRCIMCGIWKGKTGEKELDINEIKQFFQANKGFLSGLVSIGITGGEPFLRRDIVEIVRFAHAEFPRAGVGVQTNGLLTELICEKVKEIKGFYDDFGMAVSLDGIGSIHDAVRGVDGAFESVTKTIRALKAMGIKKITCGMTLTAKNYKYIKQVKEKVNEMGCEFSCFLTDVSGFYGNEAMDKQAFGLSGQMRQEVIKGLAEFGYHYYMDNLRRQLAGENKRSLPCYSGYTSFVLDAYGYVRPCILLEDAFGNIRSGMGLKDMLYSEGSRSIRKKISKCSCWNQCEVSTSAEVEVFDFLRWFMRSGNKKEIIKNILGAKLNLI